MNKDENIVGNKIRERRIELGLSQNDLAKLMGYRSKVSISNVELGKEDISTDRVQKFADVLECTPAYLMGWDLTLKETQRRCKRYATYLSKFSQLLTSYEKAPDNIQKSVCMILGIDHLENDDMKMNDLTIDEEDIEDEEETAEDTDEEIDEEIENDRPD